MRAACLASSRALEQAGREERIDGRRLAERDADGWTYVSRGRRCGYHSNRSATLPVAPFRRSSSCGRGGRLSVGRKREVVLRLLRGEDLESVSRAVGITAARASQWRDRFLAAGQASLKSRAPDARNEDDRRLQAKIGELLMENELLYAKVDQLEAGGPLARRRSRR